MIRFYKNNDGGAAKVMITAASTCVMFRFRTMFFPCMDVADAYLKSIGYR